MEKVIENKSAEKSMLKIFLWGTGCIANEILSTYQIFENYDVEGFIDNDPDKQGRKIYGKYIYAPEILLTVKVDKVVILNAKYKDIYRQITKELKLKNIIIEDREYFSNQFVIKPGILKRYKDTADLDAREVLEYIVQNELEVFNYGFREKYQSLDISVLYDKDCEMYYVIQQGKKMYFSRELDTEGAVIDYYKSILLEQDRKSPHKYLDEEFNVCYGDVVVDAGVAEGNFALEVIDQVSKIYLIEADDGWVEALKETFKNYQDKVVIIQKFLTSMDDGNYATLDGLIDEPVDFIKMDIEGNEWDALLGAEKIIRRSEKIKCSICSYHSEYDETLIRAVLVKYGLRCTSTQGYMWFHSWGRNGEVCTRLCRGIVRGIR